MRQEQQCSASLSTDPPARNWRAERPRERLQAAADRLFVTSIRAVSIDSISADAEVPKSGFYRHFSDKNDLVLDYLQRCSDRIRGELAGIDRATADPIRRLARLLPLEQGNAVMIRAAAEFSEPDTDIDFIISRYRQWVRQWIANQLVDFGVDSPRFLALEIGAIFDALTFEPAGSTEHDQIHQILLRKFEVLEAR